jgi:hypothetical protein
MLRIHRYIFYRLYNWNLKSFGKQDSPLLNALLELSMLIWLNVLTAVLLIDKIFKIKMLNLLSEKYIITIIIAFLVLIIQYFLLIHKDRHKKIIEDYKNDKSNSRKNDNMAFWYVGVSLSTFFFTLLL